MEGISRAPALKVWLQELRMAALSLRSLDLIHFHTVYRLESIKMTRI